MTVFVQQVVYMLLPLLARDDSQWTSRPRPTLVYIDFPVYAVDSQSTQTRIRVPRLLLCFSLFVQLVK